METVKVKITHTGEIIDMTLPELKVILLRDGVQLNEAKETYDYTSDRIANYYVVDAVQSEEDAHHDDKGWHQLYIAQLKDGQYLLIINNEDWLEKDVNEIVKHCINYNYPKIEEPKKDKLHFLEQQPTPFTERLEFITSNLTSREDHYEQILMLNLQNRFDDVEDMICVMIALSRVQTTIAKQLQHKQDESAN